MMISPGLSAFPLIETSRLLLRLPSLHDDRQFFILRSHPLVNKYIGRSPCKSVEEASIFIQNILDSISAHQSVYWAIQLRDHPLLAGTVCLWNYDWDAEAAELGFELLPAFQGKRYMKEAVASVVEYAFDKMNIKMLKANTDPGNQASIAVLMHAGFSANGNFSEHGEMEFFLLNKQR